MKPLITAVSIARLIGVSSGKDGPLTKECKSRLRQIAKASHR
jgi:hypothetical protein